MRFGRAQRTRAASLLDESAPKKLEARCGRRTSSPVDARASSIFLVFSRRPMVSTGPPTVVEATRSVEERQDDGDDASARLAGVFLSRGDGTPAQLAVRRRLVLCLCVTALRFFRTYVGLVTVNFGVKRQTYLPTHPPPRPPAAKPTYLPTYLCVTRPT